MELARSRRGLLTFVVGGEPFEVPWPFLALHSPQWAEKLAEEPAVAKQAIELQGEADSFRAFLNYLQGPTGDLNPGNFMAVLEWGEEFGVEHIRGQCEAFLLDPRCREAIELSPDEVLEIAARYNMPKLYRKAVEITGQGMQYIQVPAQARNTRFEAEDLRVDVLKEHLAMGMMSADGEMRCRHRAADQMMLPDAHERARIMWKTRPRFQKPKAPEPDHDWRSLHLVWPHHSLRGEDWTAVAHETQPTPYRRARQRRQSRSRVESELSELGSLETLTVQEEVVPVVPDSETPLNKS